MIKLIQEYKDILNGDPAFYVHAAVSPLFMVVTWQKETHPLHTFSIAKGRDSYISINEKGYVAIATDKFRDYFTNKISIQKLQEDYDSWAADTKQLYDEVVKTNLHLLSDDELKAYINRVNDQFLGLAEKTIYIENVEYQQILDVIGSGHKSALDAVWERATEAAFVSFEARRLKMMLDLCASNSENITREAKFIFTDYFWTKSETDISHVLNEIRQNFSEKTKEYNQAHSISENRTIKYQEWLDTLDPISRKVAEYTQLVMRMRDERKDPIAHIQAMLAELSVVMMERADIDVKLAPFALVYEYMQGVDYLVSIKSDIEGRSAGCIYLASPDLTCKTELCDYDLAVKQFIDIVHQKTNDISILKGQTACRGKVVGTVKVIVDPHDDKGFQFGDILVTSMTRPEFVPIMKKAGAVVTNEGGITCHAAIISRELNIPCVIGTKNATHILKDGDIVEVDANIGVVKILE